jgi:hypothetical protein
LTSTRIHTIPQCRKSRFARGGCAGRLILLLLPEDLEMNKNIVVIIAVFLLAAGCGASRWKDVNVEEKPNYIIRVQSQIKGGEVVEQNYRHPADIDAQTIAAFLSELTYMQPSFIMGDPKETPVFQDKEIVRIADPIAQTLNTVNENERVAFTSFNIGDRLLFGRNRKTSGLMFMDAENKLNIAFSEINLELPMDPEEAAYKRKSPDDPLAVKVSSTPLVATRDYMEKHLQPGGKAYPMWLKADMGEIKAGTEKMETAEPTLKTPPKDKIRDREQIRSQLEYLKELYDDGLITQSEYEAKRREFLEDLK